MPFKVQVGPHQVRVISSWSIYANGEPWELLNGGAIAHYASRIHLTNGSIPTTDGIIPPRTLGLVVSRLISEGMREDLEVTNSGVNSIASMGRPWGLLRAHSTEVLPRHRCRKCGTKPRSELHWVAHSARNDRTTSADPGGSRCPV